MDRAGWPGYGQRSQTVRHNRMTKQQQGDYVLRCSTNFSCKYHFPKLAYILRFCVDSVFGSKIFFQPAHTSWTKEPKPPPLPCTSAPFFQQESPSWGRRLTQSEPVSSPASSLPGVWTQMRPDHIPRLTQSRRMQATFPTVSVRVSPEVLWELYWVPDG